jgi:S-adenosylmethionine:tRNA ribosyltransferase-isomerase
MKRSQLEYSLPPELIAQHPAQRRDGSRLLVYERLTGDVRHRFFWELPDELRGELVVVNDTRVVPARLRFKRPTGGDAEVLLVEPLDAAGEWEASRPDRKLRPGQRLGPVRLIEHLGEAAGAAVDRRSGRRGAASPYITQAARGS